MAPEFLETLLQSAAAYRFRNKHRRHAERAKYAGEEQALFENLAETLGYHANKTAMRHLALRAPLRSIRNCPEALLFGTAGFLLPVLPASCTPEAVELHKNSGLNGGPCGRNLNWHRTAPFPGRIPATGRPTIRRGA